MGGYISVPSKKLQSWVSKSNNTIYQAEEDGFFVGIISADSNYVFAEIIGYTDSNASPTTQRGCASAYFNSGGYGRPYGVMENSFCFPVKKGDYYKGVNVSDVSGGAHSAPVTFYWIPKG